VVAAFQKQGGIKDQNSPAGLITASRFSTSFEHPHRRIQDLIEDLIQEETSSLRDNFSSLLPQLPSLRRSEAKPRSLFQEKQESRIQNGR
jgi:hypothetical protein